jgi:hypothetical protein
MGWLVNAMSWSARIFVEVAEILKHPQNGEPISESTFKTWDFKNNTCWIMNPPTLLV